MNRIRLIRFTILKKWINLNYRLSSIDQFVYHFINDLFIQKLKLLNYYFDYY